MYYEELLEEREGFDWDEANLNKNWVKHRVSDTECEELFFNRPLVLAYDVRHSQGEKRFYALGQTDAGRALFLAFTVRRKRIRVISARDMNSNERERYRHEDEE